MRLVVGDRGVRMRVVLRLYPMWDFRFWGLTIGDYAIGVMRRVPTLERDGRS